MPTSSLLTAHYSPLTTAYCLQGMDDTGGGNDGTEAASWKSQPLKFEAVTLGRVRGRARARVRATAGVRVRAASDLARGPYPYPHLSPSNPNPNLARGISADAFGRFRKVPG